MSGNHFDVLVIGAGVSGIGTACHLVQQCPGKTFAILERRSAIGGTWDLFRYPGIRSDSDMYTFGYRFRPWRGTKVLADGPNIRAYLEDTAARYGVTEHIRFRRKVTRTSWSTREGLWTVEATDETTGEVEVYTSRFLAGCTGYYDYDAGYRPTFPGEDRFTGRIVHPQHWPEDLDYRGKRVVVIGSGATAVTLVPAMARDAEHVTMLQRSPSYIMPIPEHDPMATALRRLGVPAGLVYRLGRARNIALQRAVFVLSRSLPTLVRRVLLAVVRGQLGSRVDPRHFSPSYNPWDERLCVVPDGDLFRSLRRGEASVVTDHIDTFTEKGVRLKSGEELPADIIVTATGLVIQIGGGATIEVDGEPVATRERVIYKGVLIDGVPNAMFVIGYTNASWTLKADLAAEYFCRLLRHMDRHGYTQVVARARPDDRAEESAMGSALRSGYIRRGDAVIPRQGTRKPWKVLNDYYRDAVLLRRGRIEDGVLRFGRTAAPGARPAEPARPVGIGAGTDRSTVDASSQPGG
ncbi:Predicted flavoprotein CzcO associated with the cation diffusion facilitator CzcD [Amycolatopsis arida]|uniref:Predicted flavoprotein CzcO associated with the cation diffusion facilitator CzcD n=1 Tax=Amycolatopsis arida TaxID=587909 RepID=A0A1I6AS54_9PSEU|nr:NAD(P)/FAD-dependent oxidoreductase [Amycolatopsis arida]TDX97562.1 cation diffusion facilitator CzcD-associated flavoprotein CzcO [Amycolatopsis arida]SFQ71524.1 Predicted flavoprotein CzcO associated with the cation diffusion facilitator CzcD [Amycolatopsis arida]